ncbi:hypothetical protein D3C76_1582460 [compost metagenome]
MSASGITENGVLCFAHLYGKRAAGMKFAAGGRIRRAGNITLQHDPFPFQLGNRNRHRREQSLGIGMQRVVEQLVPGSRLDHGTEIHDPDPGA